MKGRAIACIAVGFLILTALALAWRQPWACTGKTPSSPAAAAPITATASATPTAPAILTPTSSPTPLPLLTRLAQIDIPPRDPYDLAARLRGVPTPISRIVNPMPPSYELGDEAVFWLADLDANRHYTITATLRHISPHLYMWVQNGESVSEGALARSAQEFEERIYPTNRRYFGSEWAPGVDNDVRLTVLNARFRGAAGYFSSADEYPRAVNPYSNEREMFYINLAVRQPGTTEYHGTLAHEFQHMIHWHQDVNEETWLNEGAAQLAEFINGYNQPDSAAFARNTDTQLTTWSDDPAHVIAHYDAAYLIVTYLTQRYGTDILRQVIEQPANGTASIAAVLAANGEPADWDEIFADWVVANYLRGLLYAPEAAPLLAQARYQYRGLSEHELPFAPQPAAIHRRYPVAQEATVRQFATDYVVLEGQGDVRLTFTGALTVPVVPNRSLSGQYQWWSNRADYSAMTLTRAFDLRGLPRATLHCALWYDIEVGWDYGYIEVSTDGGATWQTLPGHHTTTEDPSGQNYGHGYTGVSGGGATPAWVQEEIDLSPFAGQQILLRFEYITDEGVNRAGWCVDDIRIPELGFTDDVETGEGEWVAVGFLRMDNVLPQRFILQLITLGDQAAVQRLTLDGGGQGAWEIRGLGTAIPRAVLAVSGATPVTTEAARYRYTITPLH